MIFMLDVHHKFYEEIYIIVGVSFLKNFIKKKQWVLFVYKKKLYKLTSNKMKNINLKL